MAGRENPIICDIRHGEKVRVISDPQDEGRRVGKVAEVLNIRQVYKPEETEAEYLIGKRWYGGRGWQSRAVGAFKRSQIERA